MRLSRKQKTLRNFLLAVLCLLAWWFFSGAKPLTLRQAIRWEALRLGMKERPEIVSAAPKRDYHQNVVFTADGKVAVAQVEPVFGGIRSTETYQVADLQGTAVLWLLEYPSLMGEIPDFCVVTQRTDGAEAEVALRMCQQVEVPSGSGTKTYDWDETYIFTAELENGVGWFYPEEKYPEGENQQAEREVIYDFRFAALGHAQENGDYAIRVSIRDSGGNIIETYEQTFERT